MLSILFIYFNHHHDSNKTSGLIYFVGLKYTGSHWSTQPNVEFWIGLPKSNPGLTKSHPQRKARSYVQKTASDKSQ